jgi:hypothetical protein
MPYLCDIRTGGANNVIEVGGKLFIEGVEFTPTNLAPIAFSQGPTSWPTGAGNLGPASGGVGQLCLARTYSAGSMGVYPASGTAGQYDTTKLACGQDIAGSSFIWSASTARYYGQAGYNGYGTLSSFDGNFRALTQNIAVGTSTYTGSSVAAPGTLFLPVQNGRWIWLTAASAFGNSLNGLNAANGFFAGTLTESGTVSATANNSRYPAMPYIGSDWVVITGYPNSSAFTTNDSVNSIIAYALNRDTGALTTLNSAWFSYASAAAVPAVITSPWDYQFSFPSNAIVETPGSSVYFYQPIMSAAALNVFIGTVSNLASTPTISAVTTAYTTALIAGVDTTNDWITTSGDIPNLSRVRFTTSSTFPAPLAAATDYWTIRVTATTSRIATSYANAVAGTYIDLTTQGTAGTLTTTAFNTLNLDTSQVACVSANSIVSRNTRAWVFSDSGINYLCIGLYEPGTTTAVTAASCNLYLWRLDSKTTATFLQKLDTGSAGRVRAFMPIDSSQKRIVVVYDDKIVFYGWNSSTNWTFQSTQNINTQDVGIDSQGRVWATDVGSFVPGIPTGYLSQSLYVYEPAGAATNITVSFQQSAYSYTGSAISSNLVVNAYDTLGARVALNVTLTRDTTNFSFTGGAASTSITTSTGGDTLVPISVFSTGQLSVLAVPT